MVQGGLFPQADSRKPIQRHPLGKGLRLEIEGGSQGRCNLLRYDEPIKSVKLSDKVAKKLLLMGGRNIRSMEQPSLYASLKRDGCLGWDVYHLRLSSGNGSTKPLGKAWRVPC